MAKHKAIIVTVDDAELKDIKGLSKRLAAKGMTVDRVMPITGVITGTCASAKVPTLEKVRGVSAIEEEVGVQLADPGATVQ